MIPDAFNFTVIFHHKFLSPPSPRQGRQGPVASDVDSLRLTIGPQASLLEQGMCLSRETDPFFECAGAPIDGYISFFWWRWGTDKDLGVQMCFQTNSCGWKAKLMSENERKRRMSWKTGIGSREKTLGLEKVPVCSLSFEHILLGKLS